MVRFLLALLITFFTVYNLAFASTYDLSGTWLRAGGNSDDRPINFVRVGGKYRYHGQERYFFPYGRLSHTIDQSVSLNFTGEDTLSGTVDFYDSRGCSFKAYVVLAEFQGPNVVNLLMTVPRYQYVRITQGANVRYECRLLETVEVPVQIYR